MSRFFRFWWRAQRPTPVRATPNDTPPDERPLGCGWFDSSHELQHGLIVREHATPDTLAGEEPLASWLELHLSGWRGPLPA
jgi:hypothetical protein